METYYNDKSLWEGFDPNSDLYSVTNTAFRKKLAENIYNELAKKIELNNLHFLVFTIWDFQKKDLPQFQNILTIVGGKIQSDDYWTSSDSIFKKYMNFLSTKNGLHFWDILHKYKNFCNPLRIYSIANEIYCSFLKTEGKPVSRFSSENWNWDLFKDDPSFQSFGRNEDLKENFDELIKNYYSLTKPDDSNEFQLLEIPMFLSIEKTNERTWFRSVATISIGLKKQDDDFVSNLISVPLKDVVTSIVTKQYHSYALQQNVRSTIAAIMSRNMSHNLGSHVLTNTKNQIIELASETDGERRKNLYGLSTLLHYLQERQDFIAVITSDDVFLKSSLNFKAHVFDFFAYDGPAIRHQTSTTPQQKNYILDNIVRSENYDRYSIEISLEIKDKEFKYIKLNSKSTSDESSLFDDILMAIPYGINGRQAFLSIIENFLRNSAKHNPKINPERNLEICIRIEKCEHKEKQVYKVNIYDNKNNFDDVINKLQQIGLLDKNGKFNNNALNFLKSDLIGKNSFKGFKEMLICIAWLNGQHDYLEVFDNPGNYMRFAKITKQVGQSSVQNNFSIQFFIDIFHEIQPLSNNTPAEIYFTRSIIEYDKYKKATPRLFLIENEEEEPSVLEAYRYLIKKRFNVNPEELNIVIQDNIVDRKNISEDGAGMFIINKTDNLFETDTLNSNSSIDKNSLIRKIKNVFPAYDEEKIYNLMKEYLFQLNPSKNETEHIQNDINGLGKYIYFKNHYETFGADVEFVKLSQEGNCKFIEGISGGNYTSNLIRTAHLNKLHAFRIIESALTRILIIDERIYSEYDHAIGNARSHTSKLLLNESQLEALKNQINSEDLGNYWSIKGKILSITNVKDINLSPYKNDILQKTEIQSLVEYLSLIKIIEPSTRKRKGIRWDTYFDAKNIHIANVNLDNLNIDILGKNRKRDSYDFISIHYGLLEKFKEAYNKINDTNLDLSQTLKLLIKKGEYSSNSTFVSVHSGRGDISNFNSLMRPTFIPLAGLDWALRNCKYILTELFYNQKY